MDVAAGQRGNAFNPGGQFGPGAANEIPSAQRWGRLAPSEQQGMRSWWEDELGVSGDDVMSVMQRLRPRGSVSSAPRWAAY